MGIEWTIACTTCHDWAWLGSMKPWKWNGFQLGNRFIAELLSIHAAAGCSLVVISDAGAFDPPWEHDDAASGWLEDLRSRWFWDSIRHDATPPQMVCATCEVPLGLPATPDAEALRDAGYRAPPAAAMPLITGRYLWFCGPQCRDRYRSAPGRIHRACPPVHAGARVRVGCQRCGEETSLGALDPDEDDALAFAEWLTEHIYGPPAGSGFDAPDGCRLEAHIDP